jgi:hypothetical protein
MKEEFTKGLPDSRDYGSEREVLRRGSLIAEASEKT